MPEKKRGEKKDAGRVGVPHFISREKEGVRGGAERQARKTESNSDPGRGEHRQSEDNRREALYCSNFV